MRAKFRCNSMTDFGSGKRFELSAVTDDGTEENRRYHTATPIGSLTITIDNPNVVDFLKVGKYFYLDFSEVEE